MEFNDYPILTDDQYNLMRQEYQSSLFFDRKNIAHKLFYILNDCNNMFYSINIKFNLKTTNAITNLNKEISKICESLAINFNIENSVSQVKDFNLFKYLRNISLAMNELIIWLTHEEKEFYKKTIQSFFSLLLEKENELFLKLEQSNIQFYKHM